MKAWLTPLILAFSLPGPRAAGVESPPANSPQSKTTYAAAYGKTRNAVSVDAQKDLPRHPAVEPESAVGTWRVKPGFRLELAAHEPQVRDPIAVCFDERGRMFVCEMVDYSEMREETPHLGRISMLEDRDGDGFYETSRVFADDLPWPTGLIWVRGGLYVGATPDIWRLEDRDEDGRAEFRQKVFTGFGSGLKLLNVQGLMNSFQWGTDNRVHVLAGGGNRGVVRCLIRPELEGEELAGRDFWFDPLTLHFGTEVGGAQYGMSYDNFGRKFGCSNSDHLQHWMYAGDPFARNPMAPAFPSRRSIAADGGAAEVFRISPDEPWRIIRTRWRVAGAVAGAVEGGGRVSGYFTGATGTTIYRGDAYGPDFVNNSFTGDAGGQLVHRKRIRPTEDGVGLVGARPEDEQGVEFAASTDTWVRVVNFANAPDGCLHICDMYREVIEHPWSIPDEIKRHLDLNSGNNRGRIYRIAPADWVRSGDRVRCGDLSGLSAGELVDLLDHPNGWHRDTAQRLLVERQSDAVVPALKGMCGKGGTLGRLHALSVLDGLHALDPSVLERALEDPEWSVRERGIVLLERRFAGKTLPAPLSEKVAALATDSNPRVRFALALAIGAFLEKAEVPALETALLGLARRDHAHEWIGPAILSAPPGVIARVLFEPVIREYGEGAEVTPFVSRVLEMRAATSGPTERAALIRFVSGSKSAHHWMAALAAGLQRAGTSLLKSDTEGRLPNVFERAARQAVRQECPVAERVAALELLGFAPRRDRESALRACLVSGQPDEVQQAALKAWGAGGERMETVLEMWGQYSPATRDTVLRMMLGRQERVRPLLEAVNSGKVPATALSAAQVQALLKSKDPAIALFASKVLSSVLPPSRDEVMGRFQPAVDLAGEPVRGQAVYAARCAACHRAGSEGVAVGPDLVTVKTRGRAGLLSAILEPNKEVAAQYILYTVNTKKGETLTGFIHEDTAGSVTLRMAGGLDQKVERAQIQSMLSSGQSLMPEGLEAGLSVQEMADLLTFIQEVK